MTLISQAQLHLALTHLPVVAALLAAATLLIGLVTRAPSTRRFGLALLLFAGVSAVPAYLTGEGAEEIVEDRPGVSEALIERHEHAASLALGLVVLGGLVAGAALAATRRERERLARTFFAGAVCLALVNSAALGWVAHLGGEIRHDEIRLASLGSARTPPEAARDSDDD